MRLYTGKRAPNGRRVEIFLAEKQLEIPVAFLDLGKDENRTETFARLNPLQRIPVLELDDGEIITESIAICRYFEALRPQPSLFGVTGIEQARVEMWNRRLELGLYFPVQHAFRHLHPAMAEREVPQVAAWGEANKPRALEMMSLLDKQLADKEFVAGDQFSVADITGLVSIDFLKPARLAVPEELANLRRWHAAISSRPSATA